MYTVDSAEHPFEEWEQVLETACEEDAISRAIMGLDKGKQAVIWDGDRKCWKNGQYVPHFEIAQSPMEQDYFRMLAAV